MAYLEKAKGFDQACNWPQTLRHANIAATKLKQLKDRPVKDIDNALNLKYHALNFMGRHKQALECAKEWLCLYPTNHTHPPAIEASFAVIQSCIHNDEFFDAALYARTLWETITMSRDSHIPDNLREGFTARGAFELARALWNLAAHGDMPVEEQKEAGKETTMLARSALEIDTQLFGADSLQIAITMSTLASILDYFNDVDDDEALRLREQALSIFARVEGSLSVNVAVSLTQKGRMHNQRARRAEAAYDMERCVANLESALLHYREAARIYRFINRLEDADRAAYDAARVEENLRRLLPLTAADRAATIRG